VVTAAEPLEDYFARSRGGDYEGALQAARIACSAQEKAPAPHYAAGEALSALGRHAEAAAAFVEALKRAPAWADAWVNLGLARYRLGDTQGAKNAMREALRHAPDHAAAAANLGALMRITGESEAGEKLLQANLDHAPGNYIARLNMAADLMQVDRGAEALALLDGAPALPSDAGALRAWRLARSLALLQLRRRDEARQELDALVADGPVPPEIAPMWLWRRVLLAEDDSEARALAGEMETAIGAMGPNALPEHRLMSHYDLARFWSARGENARAFGHWSAGHAILRRGRPFSRSAARDFIDAQMAVFDRARFSGPRAANADPAPVFIVGMPRSGTTLCEQILAAHAQVHGAGERTALQDVFQRFGDAESISRLGAAELDAAAADYLAALHQLAPEKSRIVDKMPGNELYLGLVGLMLPGARIIHCVRDPRDIGLSIWSYRFFGEHPYAHDLADLGWTIAARWRLMQHWRAALPNPILTIALSDWVEDFEATLARVLDHLGLPPDENCARFYEIDRPVRTASRAQVKQPLNARGLGRWRPYADELAPLIAELKAGGMLTAEEPQIV
jgi:tetratricopeptide (TPR) repeat protein